LIFALSKLFTALFLPPGLFVTAAFLLGFFKARRLFWSLALFIYLFSCLPLTEKMLALFEPRYPPPPAKIALVVSLGGGTRWGTPLPLKNQALRRHLFAFNLAKRRHAPLLITGADYYGQSEARAFLKTLRRLGIESTTVRLLEENTSKDTYENARYTRRLLPAHSDGPIALVTSAYHMRRALCLFEKAGFSSIYPVAVGYRHTRPFGYVWQDYLPSLEGLEAGYLALHEAFGYLKDCLFR